MLFSISRFSRIRTWRRQAGAGQAGTGRIQSSQRVRSQRVSRRRTLVETLEARNLLAANLLDGPCATEMDAPFEPVSMSHAIFAPGTPPDYVEAFEGLDEVGQGNDPLPIQLAGRWTNTATDGPGLQQGDPTTLTWSIVPDGTMIPGRGGDPARPSDLVARLGVIYGVNTDDDNYIDEPWFPILSSAYDRWTEISGLTFVYEANDDGADLLDGDGELGVRGDMRISGRFVDGNSSVLAYNYFPAFGGDMVIDTGDNFYNDISQDSIVLRNIVAHELGHGIGLFHVEPVRQQFLMEPFISTNFDGPQYDDVLAVHRHYGDFFEAAGNETVAEATPLGELINGVPQSIGTDVTTTTVDINATDFVSIDDDTDIDVFSFQIPRRGDLDVVLTPVGPSYDQRPQAPPLVPSVLIDGAAQSDLTLELIDIDGNTVLTSGDTGGLGVPETIDFRLPAAGEYYARVTGSDNRAQTYRLDLSITVSDIPQPIITGPGNPFNADPVDLLIDFGETVNGFDISEITVTGGSVTNLVDLGDGRFTATVDVDADGTVGVSIDSGVAIDDTGNPNDASPPFEIVIDTVAPVITTPADVTVEADSSGGALMENPEIAAFLNSATASDSVDPAPVITHDGPDLFPVGNTTVTFTATDHAGNIDTGTAVVTVQDTTPPSITLPPESTLDGNITGGASLTNKEVIAFLERAQANDIVDGSVNVTYDVPDPLPLGPTEVMFTATDSSGNMSQQSATMMIADISGPMLEVPENLTIEAESADGMPSSHPEIAAFLASASAEDIVSESVSIAHDGPDQFPVGDTVVIFTATDSSGNETSKAATVIVQDSIAPEISVPASVVVEGDSQAGVSADHPAISELLSGASATDLIDDSVTVTHDAPLVFPVGETIVTFVATDNHGNQSAGMVTVTVADTVAPQVSIPEQFVVEANAAGGFQVSDEILYGILSQASTIDTVADEITITHDIPSVFALGSSEIAISATDPSGNVATASTTIVVVDTTAPRINVPASIVVEADTIGGASVSQPAIIEFLAGASAVDVADPELELVHDAPDVLPLGETTVTFTASDDAGNTVSSSTVVTVIDTTVPSLSVPADLTVVASSAAGESASQAAIAEFLSAAVASDDADSNVAVTVEAADWFAIGQTPVAFTATDAAGNRWTAVATITVIPPAGPIVSEVVFDSLDVNQDGEITARDALNIINQLAIGESEAGAVNGFSRFDVNRSGSVSAADALMVINRIGKVGESQQLSGEVSTSTIRWDPDEVDQAIGELF